MNLVHEIVFGPIKSRRLGNSLGVNLLPVKRKICSFDCIYCECGYNIDTTGPGNFPTREEVQAALENRLQEMHMLNEIPDSITFAGNGEPTMHPYFSTIIDDTIKLRNKYFPQTKISVLSNSTMIHNESVFNALHKVDNNILKLDAVSEDKIKLIDQPNLSSFNFKTLVDGLKRFDGNLIIQSIFIEGTHNGKQTDNTSEEDIKEWIKVLREIKPKQVMIYSIDRATPSKTLKKVSRSKLDIIAKKAEKAGISVTAT